MDRPRPDVDPFRCALFDCAQSWVIHPSWSVADHLAWFRDEYGWAADHRLVNPAARDWNGAADLATWVTRWLTDPARAFEILAP